MHNEITISTIHDEPQKFGIEKLSGGYGGTVEKVTERRSGAQYILKSMGRSDDEIAHSLQVFKHLQGIGRYLSNMTKLLNWELKAGTLYALFEYIEATENRPATIAEMVDISTTAFLASRQYDYTKVTHASDVRSTTLHSMIAGGRERYAEQYFLPYVDRRTRQVIDWMAKWVAYFTTDREFQRQYLDTIGFIHRDIHRRNIIIHHQQPYLIDWNLSGIDCRLLEITRPTNIFIETDDFLSMYKMAKAQNTPYFTETEREIIDRVLVLDIMFMLGWDAQAIYTADEGPLKEEFRLFLQDRLYYLSVLMNVTHEFNLDFV